MYSYFISYSHEKGHGNAAFVSDGPIGSFDDLKFVQEELQSQEGAMKGIIIINYILMGE